MPVSMSVRVEDERLKRALSYIARDLSDTRKVHKRFGIMGLRWVSDNFRTEGGKVGGWAQLSGSTIAQRRGKGQGVKKLRDKGQLFQSMHWEADTRRASVGSPEKKAEWHDQGTKPFTITPKKATWLSFVTPTGRVFTKQVNHPGIPQRRIFPTEREAEGEIMLPLAESYIRDVIRKRL